MKKIPLVGAIVFLMLTAGNRATAQTTNDVLDILVKKGTITQQDVDSIRVSSADKRPAAAGSQKSALVGSLCHISGYTQVRYQAYQLVGLPSGFDIRRARLLASGNLGSTWEYRLLVDFVGQQGASGTAPTGGALLAPELLDAYLAYKPFSFLKITAGQLILPFSLENGETPDKDLLTVDRSQVVNALVARKGDASNKLVDSIGNQNGRDIGIQISGNVGRTGSRYVADYYFAVLNGAGINSTDNNFKKDISARVVFHPFKILSIGGSYYNGVDRFTSSKTLDQRRDRWGTELALKTDAFSLTAEYLRGREGDANPIRHQGWYAQAGYYIVANKLQGILKYDTYNSDIAMQNATNTYYIFGANYYFTKWTKVQADYSLRTEESRSVPNNLFTVQLQVEF